VIGITLFALVFSKILKQELTITKRELLAGSIFAGMGLAVSIMIANLSYKSEPLLNQSKAGLLLAAVISGLVGSIILLLNQRRSLK
jgi:NhaA family Na+:H+ antiporter